MLVWILAPLVVSTLLRAFGGDGWADLGIRPNLEDNLRWYALSILVYPLCAFMVVIVGLGFGAVTAPGFSEASLGLIGAAFAQAFFIQFIQNIFEESGFRGYMAPRGFRLGRSELLIHVSVGLVWGTWHLPYLQVLLTPIAPYAGENMLTLAPRFLLGAIAASLVYGEIRLRTDSLWPAVLMQTTGGAFIAALVLDAGLIFNPQTAFLFLPMVESLSMTLFFALIGLGLYAWRRRTVPATGMIS